MSFKCFRTKIFPTATQLGILRDVIPAHLENIRIKKAALEKEKIKIKYLMKMKNFKTDLYTVPWAKNDGLGIIVLIEIWSFLYKYLKIRC